MLLLMASLIVAAEETFHISFDTPSAVGSNYVKRLRFHFDVLNHTYVVSAELNDALFAPAYQETVDSGGGSRLRTASHESANAPHRHCHYTARIEGDPRGKAAFSTCGGGIDGRFWAFGHDLLVRSARAHVETFVDLGPAGGHLCRRKP